jgi:uncharacterized protein (TIGR02722 family)
MKLFHALCCLLSSIVIFTSGCATKQKSYSDASALVVVGTRWSDSDNQVVAEGIVKQVFSSDWFKAAKKSGKPKVGISKIRNLTSEEIDIDALVNYIKTKLTNSGKVTFIANKDADRAEMEKELQYQDGGSVKKDGRAKIGNQSGVGFFLKGDISSKTEMDEDVKMVNYQANFVLLNIESAEEVWAGQERVRKQFER